MAAVSPCSWIATREMPLPGLASGDDEEEGGGGKGKGGAPLKPWRRSKAER